MSHGARRFLRALSAILLVSCRLPAAVQSSSSKEVINQADASSIEVATADTNQVVAEEPEILLRRGNELLQEGEVGEAVHVLRQAILEWEKQLGIDVDEEDTSETVQRLSNELVEGREEQEAAEVFARAVRFCEKVFGKASAEVAQSMHELGVALVRQGHSSSGAKALKTALRAQPLGSDEESLTRVSSNLMSLVEALSQISPDETNGDNLENALIAVEEINRVSWRYFTEHSALGGHKMLQQAISSAQEEVDLDSPAKSLAISAYLFNLGFLRLAVLGEYSSAAELFQQTHSLRVPLLGEEHALVVQPVVSRGWALVLTGETQLALEELMSCARTLLSAGQAATAERLIRQAIVGATQPLGVHTYAHACFTQHMNLLKSWGSEARQKAQEFADQQQIIAKKAQLPPRHRDVVAARKLLSEALSAQISAPSDGQGLLKLSKADREQMEKEARTLRM